MKNTQIVKFANGLFLVDKDSPNMTVTAIEYAPHGDWKTQSVRDYFMGLNKDETGELVGLMENFYGLFCRVKRSDGKIADLDPSDLAAELIRK